MFFSWSDPYTWACILMVVIALRLTWKLLIGGPRGNGGLAGTGAILSLAVFGSWAYMTYKANSAAQAADFAEPAVTLTLSDGRTMPLSSQRGHVVLLDFWATWCAPCRVSEPAIQSLSNKYGSDGLTVIQVSGDRDVAAWKQYLRGHHSAELEVLDEDAAIANAFQVEGFPRFVVIDREGTVRWQQSGWTPFSYLLLRRAVRKSLAGQAGG